MNRTLIVTLVIFIGMISFSHADNPEEIADKAQELFQSPVDEDSFIFEAQDPPRGFPRQAPRQNPQAPQGRQRPQLTEADALNPNVVGLAAKFIAIKAGEFDMGSPDKEIGRDPDELQHRVKLTRNFEMQATEATQLQIFLALRDNLSVFRDRDRCKDSNYMVLNGRGICVQRPVENISWNDAVRFANKLSEFKGLKPCYVISTNSNGTVKQVSVDGGNIYACQGYRLPTEAEWEYAARAGAPAHFPYFFGFNDDDALDHYAWHLGNSNKQTHAVTTKKPNPWGLFGMYGNVAEWIHECWSNYPNGIVTNGIVTDPVNAGRCDVGLVRGGSWGSFNSLRYRSAKRETYNPGGGHSIGFRLVRTIP